MSSIELIATTSFGLEAVVAREIRALGYQPTIEDARVTFTGDEAAICQANLWLRAADRVQVKVGAFGARTFEELFEGTKTLPWEDWIPQGAAFPVRGKAVRSQLHHVPSCQSIVKKAIVERLKRGRAKGWLEESGPEHAVEVALLKDTATLTLDTSGAGLHRRGYRTSNAEAPLRETLAAALVLLSDWVPDRVLADPLCGSGTIPIEAAMIGLNLAPGLHRRFASEEWPRIGKSLWEHARTVARESVAADRDLQILGLDVDPDVLQFARAHARKAGVAGSIHFQALPISQFRSRQKFGCAIMNPPYGERIGDETTVSRLYKEMGQVFSALDTWSVYVITSHKEFESLYGKRANRKRKLYNGRIECTYYQFFGPRPPRQAGPGVLG